ncbi:hypothetical protein DRE_04013 [Drechslerella stenobrocha 248]|uniref:Uncharacterized protein n=1 Tax=Drechslerella stenobrocha 248 TaxID=1043628 RepID=W7I3J5_9PEZI|nr:hypothetical protein DRE_04013 [Drechslerella stenobrocha 248]
MSELDKPGQVGTLEDAAGKATALTSTNVALSLARALETIKRLEEQYFDTIQAWTEHEEGAKISLERNLGDVKSLHETITKRDEEISQLRNQIDASAEIPSQAVQDYQGPLTFQELGTQAFDTAVKPPLPETEGLKNTDSGLTSIHKNPVKTLKEAGQLKHQPTAAASTLNDDLRKAQQEIKRHKKMIRDLEEHAGTAKSAYLALVDAFETSEKSNWSLQSELKRKQNQLEDFRKNQAATASEDLTYIRVRKLEAEVLTLESEKEQLRLELKVVTEKLKASEMKSANTMFRRNLQTQVMRDTIHNLENDKTQLQRAIDARTD